MPMSEKKTLPRTFFVCDTPLVHFEVFDFHLSLLSTIPGAMAQISPCQPETQEDRKMLAEKRNVYGLVVHANPKLTLKVVDVGCVCWCSCDFTRIKSFFACIQSYTYDVYISLVCLNRYIYVLFFRFVWKGPIAIFEGRWWNDFHQLFFYPSSGSMAPFGEGG